MTKKKVTFQLIKDNELLKDEFKKTITDLSWQWREIKKSVGNNITKYYVGHYEDDIKIITCKICPSMIMTVQEIYKNCMEGGYLAPSNTRAKTFNYGASAEVRVSQSFIDNLLQRIAITKDQKQSKVMEW